MNCCFAYLSAVCKAILYDNSSIYLITSNKEAVKPTIFFKNGSYIKTIVSNNSENVYRGKRSQIIECCDFDTLKKEDIGEFYEIR